MLQQAQVGYSAPVSYGAPVEVAPFFLGSKILPASFLV